MISIRMLTNYNYKIILRSSFENTLWFENVTSPDWFCFETIYLVASRWSLQSVSLRVAASGWLLYACATPLQPARRGALASGGRQPEPGPCASRERWGETAGGPGRKAAAGKARAGQAGESGWWRGDGRVAEDF